MLNNKNNIVQSLTGLQNKQEIAEVMKKNNVKINDDFVNNFSKRITEYLSNQQNFEFVSKKIADISQSVNSVKTKQNELVEAIVKDMYNNEQNGQDEQNNKEDNENEIQISKVLVKKTLLSNLKGIATNNGQLPTNINNSKNNTNSLGRQ